MFSKVQHVIVCGHYGCSGVQTALRRHRLGLERQLAASHPGCATKARVDISRQFSAEPETFRRLCELNVIEQVANVCQTTILLDAWERGQELSVHGWIYGLSDGLLRDLSVTVTRTEEISPLYNDAIARLAARAD